MDQQLEIPNDNDMDKIAKLLAISGLLANSVAGKPFAGTLEDLDTIQQVIDSDYINADKTLELQSLGMALGQVLANGDGNYDWWMVSDEQGRDPCLRYKSTNLLIFPQTFLSKRVEDGQAIDVSELFHGLLRQLDDVKQQQFGG